MTLAEVALVAFFAAWLVFVAWATCKMNDDLLRAQDDLQRAFNNYLFELSRVIGKKK